MMNKIAGIYVILSPTNKFYVGQSWDIDKRWKQYFKKLGIGQPFLNHSFLKHNISNHKFDIVEIYHGNNQNELDELEKKHWSNLILDKESLNCREPNGSKGKHSEETKHKISLAHKGKRLGKLLTKEIKEKMSFSHKGKTITDITKKRLSESLKGKNLGKKHSQESKIKISLAKVGKMTNEHKNKLRISRSKINKEIVIKIMNMINEGYSQKSIANLFKINQSVISCINTGKAWNHITNKVNE